jgi:hypothetical protein
MAMAIPPRRVLIKGEADFLAEDETTRLLRLGLGTCKMNSTRYD